MSEHGLPTVSFRDAEVLAVRIDRGPTMYLDIEALAGTERATRYTLRFLEVSDLELGGVNEQNVLFDLTAAQEGHDWHVRIEPSYGIGATFTCRRIEWAATA